MPLSLPLLYKYYCLWHGLPLRASLQANAGPRRTFSPVQHQPLITAFPGPLNWNWNWNSGKGGHARNKQLNYNNKTKEKARVIAPFSQEHLSTRCRSPSQQTKRRETRDERRDLSLQLADPHSLIISNST